MTMRGVTHVIAASAMAALMHVIGAPPTATANSGGPAWAFDPAEPGGDYPPVGRSLFDHIFVAERDGQKVYDVPFPFSALRDRVLQHLGGERGATALKQVLIPYSRALPRDAAAPDYLTHPRIVLAVDGDTTASGGAALLKDRLFIGYQEKARSLEVISYNEPAGRFEFQVVENYAAGRAPRVMYANRRLCVACHQNGAPIFSGPLWSESNGNPGIGEAILGVAPDIHGIRSYDGAQTIDQPRAIGESVRRANRYSAYQEIWRNGCGGPPRRAAARCRAAVLTLALQLKLGGGRNIDTSADRYRDELVGQLDKNRGRLWPSGLAVPDPSLPDRDPLNGEIDVTAAFDPLRLRPPLAIWDGVAERFGSRVIEGLAQFISNDDARRLDSYLFARGRSGGAARAALQVPCAVSGRAIDGSRHRIVFRCDPVEPGAASVTGFFYRDEGTPIRGEIQRLTTGGSVSFEDLSFSAPAVVTDEDGASIQFRPMVKRTGRHARMPDGNAIESIRLSWTTIIDEAFGPSDEMPDYPDNGRIVLSVVPDFAPVHRAVEGLVNQAVADPAGALSDRPFRRVALMRGLFGGLGLQSAHWCCEDDVGYPPVAVEASLAPPVGGVSDGDVAATMLESFAAYCGTCHGRADRFPANFLGGNAGQQRERISRCAERIAFRLAMWDRPRDDRAKSPMPPAAWLNGAGLSPRDWRESEDFSRLRRFVAGLQPAATDPERAYATLDPCIAEAK